MGSKDTARIEKLVAKDYYLDTAAIQNAIAHRSKFNMIHLNHVVKVDCIVRKDTEYRRLEFSHRRPVEISGKVVFTVSPEDLLISKLEWARDSKSEFQLRDIRNLIASVKDLDWDYVREWASRPRRLATGGDPMRDTPPEIEQIYQAMLMARSGPERLRMGCDLFSTSRELVISALNKRDPTEVRQHLFLRFYGPEFTPAEQARILSSIRTPTCH